MDPGENGCTPVITNGNTNKQPTTRARRSQSHLFVFIFFRHVFSCMTNICCKCLLLHIGEFGYIMLYSSTKDKVLFAYQGEVKGQNLCWWGLIALHGYFTCCQRDWIRTLLLNEIFRWFSIQMLIEFQDIQQRKYWLMNISFAPVSSSILGAGLPR